MQPVIRMGRLSYRIAPSVGYNVALGEGVFHLAIHHSL